MQVGYEHCLIYYEAAINFFMYCQRVVYLRLNTDSLDGRPHIAETGDIIKYNIVLFFGYVFIPTTDTHE